MTFKSKFAPKSLLIGSVAAVALTLSGGALTSVSAQGDHSAKSPVTSSQCDHPGYKHFGFSSKQACQNYVTAHAQAQGGVNNGNGNGYGGNGNGNNTSLIVSIGDVVNSAVNITINFVTNIFS